MVPPLNGGPLRIFQQLAIEFAQLRREPPGFELLTLGGRLATYTSLEFDLLFRKAIKPRAG